MVIFDTNILIELYRGNVDVKNEIHKMGSDVFYISSITTAEFIAGARDKAELAIIEKQLSRYVSIPLNEGINDIFIDIIRTLILSHRPQIPDVLIAATAIYYSLPLYTLNKKHFQYIAGIHLI
jgi:hypothetical protein